MTSDFGLGKGMPMGRMRTISSPMTFFYKFVLTGVWFLVVGAATVSAFTDPSSSRTAWLGAAFWLGSSALLWMLAGTLKRVRIDDGRLLISNYVSERAVPVSGVSSVSQNILLVPSVVTLELKAHEGAGASIRFIPDDASAMFGLVTGEGSVAKQLRTTIEQASRPAQQ